MEVHRAMVTDNVIILLACALAMKEIRALIVLVLLYLLTYLFCANNYFFQSSHVLVIVAMLEVVTPQQDYALVTLADMDLIVLVSKQVESVWNKSSIHLDILPP